ncbi:MAG TPA: hypothetical protein VN282_23305 [Pyrinomonadaceae bacterium]|nr:hypothetical protein [Pyrinomonadaceae bacterium]
MTQAGLRAGIREGSGIGREAAPTRKLFGLVELDAAGTVLYARIEADGATPDGVAPDYTGRNFYTEVAPFSNVVELRDRLDRFSRGTQPALSFDFTCDYEDGPVRAKVLLARIRERSQSDETKSVLVHIRRAQ